jgi:hypothetical protein
MKKARSNILISVLFLLIPSSFLFGLSTIPDEKKSRMTGFVGRNCALSGSGDVKCWHEAYGNFLFNLSTKFKNVSSDGQVIDVILDETIGDGIYMLSSSGKLWFSPYCREIKSDECKQDEAYIILDNVADIDGESRICALLRDGRIRCPERYRADADVDKDSEPLRIEGPKYLQAYFNKRPAGYVHGVSEATAVSVGWSSSCALLKDGAVRCWGSNFRGSLGDGGDYRENGSASKVSVPVSGLSNVVQIAAGMDHFCALLKGGGIKCWGDNQHGQLGGGSTEKMSKVPVPVKGINNAIKVSAGTEDSCALLKTGRILCWGQQMNYPFIRLRAGISDANTPRQVYDIYDAIDLTSSSYIMSALRKDGSIWYWSNEDSEGWMFLPIFPGLIPHQMHFRES